MQIGDSSNPLSRLETVRVFRLPCPHVPTHVLQVQLCLESKLFLSEGGGGKAARHVSGPPIHYLIGNLFTWKVILYFRYKGRRICLTRDSLESLDNLEHGDALASAEVIDLDSVESRIDDLLEGGHVTFGDVHDVDVVTAASPVLGVKISSIYKQLGLKEKLIQEYKLIINI